jgi:hypothetical protein
MKETNKMCSKVWDFLVQYMECNWEVNHEYWMFSLTVGGCDVLSRICLTLSKVWTVCYEDFSPTQEMT